MAVARSTPSSTFKTGTTPLGSASGTTSSTILSVPILSAKTSNKPDYVQTEQRLSNLLSKPFLDASTAKLLSGKAGTWKTDATLFWEPFELSGSSFDDSLPQIVVNCLPVPSNCSYGIICRRFHCVALVKTMCISDAVLAVAKVIHEANILPGYSIKDLRSGMGRLLQAGVRYLCLVKRFGTGCLVVLGQNAACSTWEKYLPIKGQECNNFLDSLENKGLSRLAEPWTNFADKLLQQIIESYPHVQSLTIEMKPVPKLNRKRSHFEDQSSNKCPRPTANPLRIAPSTTMGASSDPNLRPHLQQNSGREFCLTPAASPPHLEAVTKGNYAPARIRGANSPPTVDDLHQRAQATSEGSSPSGNDIVNVVAPEKNRILTDTIVQSALSKTAATKLSQLLVGSGNSPANLPPMKPYSVDSGGSALLTIESHSITDNSDMWHTRLTHPPTDSLSAVNEFTDSPMGNLLATNHYQSTNMVVPRTHEPLIESWGSADDFAASLIVRSSAPNDLLSVNGVVPQTHQPLMTSWSAADDFAASSIVRH